MTVITQDRRDLPYNDDQTTECPMPDQKHISTVVLPESIRVASRARRGRTQQAANVKPRSARVRDKQANPQK